MENSHKIAVIISFSISFGIFIILALICVCRRKGSTKNESWDKETGFKNKGKGVEEMEINGELVKFNGGEYITSVDILDAPGEVIGKSGYGTLYRANLVRIGSVVCLRFLRPTCTQKVQDLMHKVELIGSVRHPNLVPLYGFYYGPRDEKLLVYPYYEGGNLAHFIRDQQEECHKWTIISRISMGIARGLDYLHTGLPKPLIHGNLKSKNIFLDQNQQPFISDFGLHTFLNLNAAQEMLEAAALEGYKAPELIKVQDVNKASDIYSFGKILLELQSGKEPFDKKASPDQDSYHPEILFYETNGGASLTNEERAMRFFQLAIACCSPSPSLRPDIKQICRKLEEI
ncbi:hypothetical protein M8C21_002261 [Ambrosia artemisiifolia]|uniref:Protein kinase domain-containing protein n=1 Tax=Ambrosia artemisiifolia TaxID=4212 RepID=A0AAD5CF46_AMBAR|nr:hypothetical protein M8C21_002261 [Ambrosia artemisiifolia]